MDELIFNFRRGNKVKPKYGISELDHIFTMSEFEFRARYSFELSDRSSPRSFFTKYYNEAKMMDTKYDIADFPRRDHFSTTPLMESFNFYNSYLGTFVCFLAPTGAMVPLAKMDIGRLISMMDTRVYTNLSSVENLLEHIGENMFNILPDVRRVVGVSNDIYLKSGQVIEGISLSLGKRCFKCFEKCTTSSRVGGDFKEHYLKHMRQDQSYDNFKSSRLAAGKKLDFNVFIHDLAPVIKLDSSRHYHGGEFVRLLPVVTPGVISGEEDLKKPTIDIPLLRPSTIPLIRSTGSTDVLASSVIGSPEGQRRSLIFEDTFTNGQSICKLIEWGLYHVFLTTSITMLNNVSILQQCGVRSKLAASVHSYSGAMQYSKVVVNYFKELAMEILVREDCSVFPIGRVQKPWTRLKAGARAEKNIVKMVIDAIEAGYQIVLESNNEHVLQPSKEHHQVLSKDVQCSSGQQMKAALFHYKKSNEVLFGLGFAVMSLVFQVVFNTPLKAEIKLNSVLDNTMLDEEDESEDLNLALSDSSDEEDEETGDDGPGGAGAANNASLVGQTIGRELISQVRQKFLTLLEEDIPLYDVKEYYGSVALSRMLLFSTQAGVRRRLLTPLVYVLKTVAFICCTDEGKIVQDLTLKVQQVLETRTSRLEEPKSQLTLGSVMLRISMDLRRSEQNDARGLTGSTTCDDGKTIVTLKPEGITVSRHQLSFSVGYFENSIQAGLCYLLEKETSTLKEIVEDIQVGNGSSIGYVRTGVREKSMRVPYLDEKLLNRLFGAIDENKLAENAAVFDSLVSSVLSSLMIQNHHLRAPSIGGFFYPTRQRLETVMADVLDPDLTQIASLFAFEIDVDQSKSKDRSPLLMLYSSKTKNSLKPSKSQSWGDVMFADRSKPWLYLSLLLISRLHTNLLSRLYQLDKNQCEMEFNHQLFRYITFPTTANAFRREISKSFSVALISADTISILRLQQGGDDEKVTQLLQDMRVTRKDAKTALRKLREGTMSVGLGKYCVEATTLNSNKFRRLLVTLMQPITGSSWSSSSKIPWHQVPGGHSSHTRDTTYIHIRSTPVHMSTEEFDSNLRAYRTWKEALDEWNSELDKWFYL